MAANAEVEEVDEDEVGNIQCVLYGNVSDNHRLYSSYSF